MSKILTLWRHAKAHTASPTNNDHDRALTERGVADARRMADFMAQHHSLPDEVWCSTSMRTRETLAALPTLPTRLLSQLYLASAEDLFAQLKGADDANNHLMVIGHNPGLHMFAYALARDAAKPDYLEQLTEKFSTASVAVLHCNITRWHDLKPACGTLNLLQYAKALPQ